MSILTTFPGRFGDLIWALPTVRAIAEGTGEQVDLAISKKYGSLKPLLEGQNYLRAVHVVADWEVVESAPMTPREAPLYHANLQWYDPVIHLGYKGWPSRPLPFEVYESVYADRVVPLAPLSLDRPWITPAYRIAESAGVLVGFTDEHFELKYGLYWLLYHHLIHQKDTSGWTHPIVNLSTSPRWTNEGGCSGYDWLAAAAWLASGEVFLGCCSALHVLAVAVGCPAVVMEPAEARLHPIFWPLGQNGPQVTLVKGTDGKATFDARHVIDVVMRTRRVRV